jgi:ATP-dependent Clp protease ATP-binding subunit ClpB
VDFRNTVVVMTSNLGSQRIQELAGEGYDAMKSAVMDVVSHHFRPEFINRVDELVVFHPLDRKQIRLIAGIQLDHLRSRLEQTGLHLEVSDKALDLLGNAGFDPVYGARPLKRAIQTELENPLAQKILAGDFTPGETIHVDAIDGRFVFHAVLEGEVVNA